MDRVPKGEGKKKNIPESQKDLEKRLEEVSRIYKEIGVFSNLDDQEKKLKESGNLEKFRELVEHGEVAASILKKAFMVGGAEFVHFLIDERDAGRLSEVESWEKLIKDKTEERSKIRRNELNILWSRAQSLGVDNPERGPLLLKIGTIKIDDEENSYRQVVSGIRKAIEKAEK